MSEHDENLTMIEDCENRESKLSEWEASFIESLREQIERGRFLSQKQADILNKIWDRIT